MLKENWDKKSCQSFASSYIYIMRKLKIQIPSVEANKDLRIIYKGEEGDLHEFFVSKEEFLKKLRHFQSRANEINQTNLVFIQEDISFCIFEGLITSITTQEVEIDDNNYQDYYYLWPKYEYKELKNQIDKFIKERPDITAIIDDLSNPSKNDDNINSNSLIEKSINAEKEELIAKNIDIAIQNGNLNRLPLQILNRILNSPKIGLNDHHLLFSFVINMIKSKSKEKLSKSDIENLKILPSCLDYMKMSNSEIEELFAVEANNAKLFVNPKNSEERMKEFISTEKVMDEKSQQFEEKVIEVETKMTAQIEKLQRQIEEIQYSLKNYVSDQINKKDELLNLVKKVEKSQQQLEKKQSRNEGQITDNKSRIVAIESRIKETMDSDKACPNGIFSFSIRQIRCKSNRHRNFENKSKII